MAKDERRDYEEKLGALQTEMGAMRDQMQVTGETKCHVMSLWPARDVSLTFGNDELILQVAEKERDQAWDELEEAEQQIEEQVQRGRERDASTAATITRLLYPPTPEHGR